MYPPFLLLRKSTELAVQESWISDRKVLPLLQILNCRQPIQLGCEVYEQIFRKVWSRVCCKLRPKSFGDKRSVVLCCQAGSRSLSLHWCRPCEKYWKSSRLFDCPPYFQNTLAAKVDHKRWNMCLSQCHVGKTKSQNKHPSHHRLCIRISEYRFTT